MLSIWLPALQESLRRLDGKRLFHAAAKDGIELFDKEIFVVIAHNMLPVCIYSRSEGLAASSSGC
jgi:hypothetical protein